MESAAANSEAAEIKFPVLRINPSHILRFRSAGEMRRMSQNYFDTGDFKRNAFLIDSAGRRYAILDVVKRRLSWNPLIQIGRRSPAIIVDYHLGPPAQLTLDDIKRLIVDLVVAHRWYRQGYESERQFRSAFMSFHSFVELLDNISFYGKWQG